MNLNDFVVLPNNKARSVKLNARNLQRLQMNTVTLANESKDMEEKLLQLRENMSKEKEERGHSRGFKWTFGQYGSSDSNSLPNNCRRNKDSKIQKLSAGKMKIRVLKDDSMTAPLQPEPSPSVLNVGMTNRSIVKEICGHCETERAGFMCTECTENYCLSCFSKCHQKGALKFHSMIPTEEKKVEAPEDKRRLASSILRGHYSEEESAQSFQEALMLWRAGRSDGVKQTTTTDAKWIPAKSVLVSAMATQADLPLAREAEGRRGSGNEKQAVKMEFTENRLTYMDRLFLKKHRRAPIESHHPSLGSDIDLKSLTTSDTEEGEEVNSSLTAEEEDFHHYFASLFAVSDTKSKSESQISTPESFLVIDVLDETCRDIKRDQAAEQKTDNIEISVVQQISWKGQTPMCDTTVSSGGSLKADHSLLSPTPSTKHSVTSVHCKPAKKIILPDHQVPKPDKPVKALSSKSKTSTYPTAETPGASKKSVKTPRSQSSMPVGSHTFHKSKANYRSPQVSSSLPHSHSEMPKSAHSPVLFFTDLSTLNGNMSVIPEDHLSSSSSALFSLRSTFRVSPSSSTQSDLLPKVYHSAPQQKGADSSLLSETPQSPQLFADTISSLELCEAPSGNLFSPQQSRDSMSDPKCLPSENQLTRPLPPVSARHQPPPKSLGQVRSIISPVPGHRSVFPHNMSDLQYREVPVFVSSSPDDHKLILSHQDTQHVLSSRLSNIINSSAKLDKDKEPSVDSEDEMSSDSMALAPHEGDSSEADAETDLQADAPEQESEPLMVMQHQIAGSGSERFCDVDEFSPLGLDTDTGHPDSTEYAHCDRFHACQLSACDSDPTDSCLGHSLRSCTQEHLDVKEMDSYTQPMGIQIHSSRRERMSADEPGTSGSEISPPFRSSSRAAREIMEICSVDQTGCQDPDIDTDTAEHMLQGLEEELSLMSTTQGTSTFVFNMGNDGIQNRKHYLEWGGVSEEQNEEEEAAERDRQSVLLLP